MTKRALLAGALALTAFATPAAHAEHLDLDKYLPAIAIARCSGQVDVACIDSSGAFCTVWVNFRCSIGA